MRRTGKLQSFLHLKIKANVLLWELALTKWFLRRRFRNWEIRINNNLRQRGRCKNNLKQKLGRKCIYPVTSENQQFWSSLTNISMSNIMVLVFCPTSRAQMTSWWIVLRLNWYLLESLRIDQDILNFTKVQIIKEIMVIWKQTCSKDFKWSFHKESNRMISLDFLWIFKIFKRCIRFNNRAPTSLCLICRRSKAQWTPITWIIRHLGMSASQLISTMWRSINDNNQSSISQCRSRIWVKAHSWIE